jgi:hypothetical protein
MLDWTFVGQWPWWTAGEAQKQQSSPLPPPPLELLNVSGSSTIMKKTDIFLPRGDEQAKKT